MEIFPTVDQLLYSTLTFFILLFLLAKFAFPPIVKLLEEREEKIKDSIDKAEETRREAEKLFDEYKQQMAEARKEAQNIIEQGKKLGENMKADIINKAQNEAVQIIDRSKAEIEREKEKVVQDLQKQFANITIDAASKVVNKSLAEKDHLKLIDEYISKVGSVDEG